VRNPTHKRSANGRPQARSGVTRCMLGQFGPDVLPPSWRLS